MADQSKKSLRLRFSIRRLMLLFTMGTVAFYGYQKWVVYQRIEHARQWAASIEEYFPGYYTFPWTPEVAESQKIPILVAGVFHLETRYEKTCCLKILAERYSEQCTEALVQIALCSKDLEIQRIAVHLLSLKRDVDVLDRLEPLANSPDPLVRAARLDCIGFTRWPAYEHAFTVAYRPPGIGWDCERGGRINSSPTINTSSILLLRGHTPRKYSQSRLGQRKEFPNHYRKELEKVMLAENSSQPEREAAARAIVTWAPQDYQLRYAEWGVWINSEGKFHLVDSIIDEIPEFVHRPGNKLDSFAERLSIQMFVSKPVIHLTCDRPMAIDLDVAFNLGRPWFAYPRPDDFQVVPADMDYERFLQLARAKDFEPVGPPIGVREGYPWALPRHRQHYTQAGQGHVAEIAGLGLHWQSAIVSPTRLPWMELPEVGADSKFQWWEDLRDVECSWVSSLNESERFIYYDGPTLARSPLDLSCSWGRVQVSTQAIFDPPTDLDVKVTKDAQTAKRTGFIIRVDENGTFGAQVDLKDGAAIDTEKIELTSVDDLKASMFDSLKQAGLNDQEANGLMKCWTPAFFEQPGQRVVFLLHRSEYDLMCPMSLRPEPTELARVGLVLTELED